MSNDKNGQPSGRNKCIGIVGAGVMGRGIAQLFLQAGYPVRLYDAQAGALDSAAEFIGRMVRRQVDKGRYTVAEAENLLSGLSVCRDMKELAACDILVEAIVELLDVKKQLFAQLEEHRLRYGHPGEQYLLITGLGHRCGLCPAGPGRRTAFL